MTGCYSMFRNGRETRPFCVVWRLPIEVCERDLGYRRKGYMKKCKILTLMALVCLAAFPVNVLALPISGVGEYGNSFIGSIEYTPGGDSVSAIDAAGGSLIVTLTNTSERREYMIAGLSLASPYLNARSEVFIGTGQTAMLNFPVTDPSFSRLTTESFLTEGSELFVYFRDTSGTTWDRVRVSRVPEPEVILLLGVGLLALGVFLRWRSM
mgnify:CR=1 FL=1